MKLRRFFLFPFSLLYGFITGIRNYLYDKKFFRSATFDIPVICIGNLKVGGTGKTPHVEYVVKTFSTDLGAAVLSRGYGRASKGYVEVAPTTPAKIAGDEPAQYRRKFGSNIQVAVCENRVYGIERLTRQFHDLKAVVLDDAMQHRRVRPGLTIMLTEFNTPFFRDSILPGGWLRENRYGARRADTIIITKCPPTLSEETKNEYRKSVTRYSGPKPVFFTRYEYGAPVNLYETEKLTGDLAHYHVLAVSGIANPGPFHTFLRQHCASVETLRFADHYAYTLDDENKIARKFQRLPHDRFRLILTTEKDAVKFKDLNLLTSLPVAYIPIETAFLEKENEFRQLVGDFLN